MPVDLNKWRLIRQQCERIGSDILPFGAHVEGLSHFWDKGHTVEAKVQTD